MQSWIFSIITAVFSVTRFFRNHSNMLFCSRNISYYYQCFMGILCLIWPDVFCASVRVWKCSAEDVDGSCYAWFQPHDGGWTDRIRPTDVHARRRSVSTLHKFLFFIFLISFLPFWLISFTTTNVFVHRVWCFRGHGCGHWCSSRQWSS